VTLLQGIIHNHKTLIESLLLCESNIGGEELQSAGQCTIVVY